MSGVLYGVGVGPGDPELLTIKAVKVIEQADVIIVPKAGANRDSTALAIAKPYISEHTQLLELVFPMAYDQQKLSDAWLENKKVIGQLLKQGQRAVFLTLGDPMLYSTFIYLHKLLKDHYAVEVIPGVTSFCAVSSYIQYPLAEADETLCIIPATAPQEQIQKLLEYSDNVVIMKASRNSKQLINQLRNQHMLENAVLVSRCGMEGQTIITDLEDVGDQKLNYFSTILASKKK